ncbi:class II fructose-bisphosphatase [Gracilibacillus oryzae]|uniref:Fructose-1,6-bisphosphatase n=1 Tax=Gracilibacillus oryzae TaxID=1672701 RepID=A0A7C8GSP3_9BACI|nr:class II fructose-bisphosphatase [Gracilibacillus oryzae]KAB8132321.1 class II fructose-bisphosphatase [Gracilibacillus oryzae]
MKDLTFDFLKVTEQAALASFPWIGSGDKIKADGAATNAMRDCLNGIEFDGRIVIGEGELDHAPMLFIGENVGTGSGQKVDIAVDPIEGTNSIVNGQDNAFAVIAAAPQGTLLHAPDMYMEKLVAGPQAAGKIDLDASLTENVYSVAKANNKNVKDMKILIQNRKRHEKAIAEIRNLGAKVHLFNDGDITYAIATCMKNQDFDLFYGIGGAPEGVVAAVAVKCLGGEMQARLLPQNDQEGKRCLEMGIKDPEKTLRHEDLVNSDQCVFSATGITGNILLDEIKLDEEMQSVTHSLLLTGENRQVRFITSKHVNKDMVLS